MISAGELVSIQHDVDVVTARQKGRELAMRQGFAGSNLTLIATAISEVARNIVTYAGHGEIELIPVSANGRHGIKVVATDTGPGIADLELAMRDGWSTAKSLGLGLPGARRMMDDFEIDSQPGVGTTVVMWKWLP
jgi:serine/threonine-protein kinase RsbT